MTAYWINIAFIGMNVMHIYLFTSYSSKQSVWTNGSTGTGGGGGGGESLHYASSPLSQVYSQPYSPAHSLPASRHSHASCCASSLHSQVSCSGRIEHEYFLPGWELKRTRGEYNLGGSTMYTVVTAIAILILYKCME